MGEPSLAQLDEAFKAARQLADTSSVYGHLITDDQIRKFVAVIAKVILDTPGTPSAGGGSASGRPLGFAGGSGGSARGRSP